MLSMHAYGLAVDIYEVDPIAGDRLFVRDDYIVAEEGGVDFADRASLFLRQLESESNASGQFRRLLTPANDPRSHDDHFHYEARVGPMGGATKRKRKRNVSRHKKKRPTRRN